jgi:HSP20 family molecular chaperone IbpA
MKSMFLKNDDLDFLFGSVFGNLLNDFTVSTDSEWKQEKGTVNWDKDNEEYNIVIPVPGFSKEEIKIEFDSKGLNVSGELKNEKMVAQLGNRKISYIFNKTDLDGETIQAELTNGILNIKIKKAKDKSSKIIEII